MTVRTVPEIEYRRATGAATVQTGTDSAGAAGTVFGRIAVWGERNRIADISGDFDEEAMPGAFARTFAEREPLMMWQHGKGHLDALPIGRWIDFGEDGTGAYLLGRRFVNRATDPIWHAATEGVPLGLSMRFSANRPGADRWVSDTHRQLVDIDVPEVSLVTFPAYRSATATVRGHATRPRDRKARDTAELRLRGILKAA